VIDSLAAIRARRSCRTFDPRPLDPADRAAIEAMLEARTAGPFGSRLRFRLLDATRVGASPEVVSDRASPGLRLGTWGIVRGAPSFVAGGVRRGPTALLDFGWALEEIVLEITERGLGTCWLAGTFFRAGFARAIDLQKDELLPAVTPVGRVRHRPTLLDATMRAGAGSSGRRPWRSLFFEGELGRPLTQRTAGPWAPCLEAVRRAPSASNAQPWRIVREADRPAFRLLVAARGVSASWRRLDAGIALCHFHLAARQLGLPGDWRLLAPPRTPDGLLEVAVWDGT
jgi:nitroreductase